MRCCCQASLIEPTALRRPSTLPRTFCTLHCFFAVDNGYVHTSPANNSGFVSLEYLNGYPEVLVSCPADALYVSGHSKLRYMHRYMYRHRHRHRHMYMAQLHHLIQQAARCEAERSEWKQQEEAVVESCLFLFLAALSIWPALQVPCSADVRRTRWDVM